MVLKPIGKDDKFLEDQSQRMMIMPRVLRVNEISARILALIFVTPASRVTPTSSGSGEAMTNPARKYRRYILILLMINLLERMPNSLIK